jgi:hypothetical protein
MTPRLPIGVSGGEYSLLPNGCQEVINDSQPHGYAFFK